MFLYVIYIYAFVIVSWYSIRIFLRDQLWWLFVFNTFAPYLFVPLPLMMVYALFTRSLGAGVSMLIVSIIALNVIKPIYLLRNLGRQKNNISPDQKSLSVMTWNMLYKNKNVGGVVAAIRSANADLVGLQELSVEVANQLFNELKPRYPYQYLQPFEVDSGMGILSCYPFVKIEHQINGIWIGAPQTIEITVEGQSIVFVNAHPISTPPVRPSLLPATIRQRKLEIRNLIHFVNTQKRPVVMVGDFNTTPYNADYALITRCMNDAWEQSGHGMGNTFPGVNSFEREGKLLFSLIPKWLIRIDFIFHTFDITTSHAEIGVWDQNSDHRPVVARLNLPLSNRPTR